MSAVRHFLDLDRLDATTLRQILDRGAAFKRNRRAMDDARPLAGRTVAMIFEKPSTRTRVSFEAAIVQLGGQAIVMNAADMQLGRGETIADTARVLSRYVDAVMLRTTSSDKLFELAQHASIPIINGLTDQSHPCQIMADLLTFEEHRGPIKGRVVAWSGDGNNVARSWIHAAVRFDFEFRLACPPALRPGQAVVDWAKANGGRITVTDNPGQAVQGADCVVTDTWTSMGSAQAVNGVNRHNLLAPYRVDERLMAAAKADAIFMHCLPAHRGEEVTPGVIDGPRSVVWDEAENRLHTQKGVLAWCLDPEFQTA